MAEYKQTPKRDFSGNDWECQTWIWNSLKRIFRRAWWQRAWVLQEVCVAPGAVIVLGECMFVWLGYFTHGMRL